MRSKFTWMVTLLLVFSVQIGFAQQQKQITGVVTTEFGDPIPGVSVMLVGTNQGTSTNLEGKYSLNAKDGDRISFVFEGYTTTTLRVSGSNVLNVTMVEDLSELEEIVVDTYRTTTREENTMAISSVTAKTIEGRPNASFLNTIQGQIPGLNIATGSGQPGSSNTQTILRGIGSINGSVEPLYIIDGVPMSSSRFRSLNPNDIERIDVLKDAGATAIYGNRGANGVIVINTKRGSFDADLSVRYMGTTGVSSLQRNQFNLMNTSDYARFIDQVNVDYPGLGLNPLTDEERAINTNWIDVFFNDAISQNHTLTFSAGSKNLSSFTSIGYADFGGTLKGTGLQRFNIRSNLDGKNNNGRLTYGTNFNVNYSKTDMENTAGTSGVNNNFFIGAFRSLPYLSPDRYGGNGQSVIDMLNEFPSITAPMPYMLMDRMRGDRFRQNEVKMLVNGNINYKLSDHFSIGNQTGVDYQYIEQHTWSKYDTFNELYFGQPQGRQYFGRVGNIGEDRMIFTTNTNLRYQNSWDKHKVNAGAYVEYVKAHFKSRSVSKQGFDPIFWSDGGSTGWINPALNFQFYAPTGAVGIQNAGLFSYFANASYDYDTRYGLDATVRRDASFRFANDNRWGTFWAVSGRWNISNEDFMDGSVFNNLKLRGSYGSSGNQDILGTGVFGAAHLYDTRYSAGAAYNQEQGLFISGLPNPHLQWEVITQTNIGLDFGVWNNRLRGALDVYRKQTDDLYLSRPVSAINGAATISANYGSMKNEGIEAQISGDIIRNDNTVLTLNLVGAYNKNTVLDIPSEEGWFWNGSSLVGYREGGMINEFYTSEYLGINPDNGNMMFRDRNGGTTEEPNDFDNQWLGKSAFPIYQGSFGLDLEHKGWFLTANFTYALDLWRYDNEYYFFMAPGSIGHSNLSNDLFDYWTPDNRNASFPALQGSNFAYASGSSYYLQDASYVRLRYLNIGYNFKKEDLNFMKLSGLRVFAQGENLYTWSKWRGWDAESSRAVDYAQYPTPRTVSVGVEVQF